MLWRGSLFVRARESGIAGHRACAMCARAAHGGRSASRNSRVYQAAVCGPLSPSAALRGPEPARPWMQRRGSIRPCRIWKLAQARWVHREHIAGYVARDKVIIRGYAPDTPVLSVQRSCPASALRFPSEDCSSLPCEILSLPQNPVIPPLGKTSVPCCALQPALTA